MDKNETALTVFYDGSCPLCLREINFYKKRPSKRPIHWMDISKTNPTDHQIELSQCDAMKRFHVMDQDHKLISGAAAFSLLWRQYKGFKYLGLICSLPLFSALAEISYRVFLKIRPHLQLYVKKWTR